MLQNSSREGLGVGGGARGCIPFAVQVGYILVYTAEKCL